jgi:uncharacterized coiled-coil DUF342 family protein
MTKEELWAEVRDLKGKNTELHNRLTLLKQQSTESRESSELVRQPSIEREVRELKERIAEEERETMDLKRELVRLMKEQEDLQLRIQKDNAVFEAGLIPELAKEESLTTEFYKSVLESCRGIRKSEYEILSGMIEVVQRKRKAVAEASDENRKVSRLIHFHGGGVRQDALPMSLPCPGVGPLIEERPDFGNPLPCFGATMEQKRVRKKLSFKHLP